MRDLPEGDPRRQTLPLHALGLDNIADHLLREPCGGDLGGANIEVTEWRAAWPLTTTPVASSHAGPSRRLICRPSQRNFAS